MHELQLTRKTSHAQEQFKPLPPAENSQVREGPFVMPSLGAKLRDQWRTLLLRFVPPRFATVSGFISLLASTIAPLPSWRLWTLRKSRQN
uniref:Uncharacterized protein n=1 Tax=Mesocestoides corti TaxID=53468 RepID=A0A5K3EKP1_MESCO